MKKIVFALVCCVLFIQGCASITKGSHQKVPISSTPSKAYVTTDSGYTGTTPCFFDLERSKQHILTFTKEGYKTSKLILKKTMSGATAGNILVGGIIGLGVDAISGAMFKLVPEEVNVTLEPGHMSEEVIVKTKVKKKVTKKKTSIKPKGSTILNKENLPAKINNKPKGLPAPSTKALPYGKV